MLILYDGKGMMLAHGDGRRRRGRPRRKWMDEIREVTGMKLAELRDVTTERKKWRRLVKTVSLGLEESTPQGNKVLYAALMKIMPP